jgi:hypothetical protein
MWYTYYRRAEDHQAALRAERNSLHLAEQARSPRRGGLLDRLNDIARLLDTRRAAHPHAAHIPEIPPPSARRVGAE